MQSASCSPADSVGTPRPIGFPAGRMVPATLAQDGPMKIRPLISLRLTLAFLLGVGASLASTILAAGPVTAYKGARLIDGTGRAPVENSVLVVQDGKILVVGPAATTAIPKDATVVDLTGRTIMPGLVNAHGHLGLTSGNSLNPQNYNRENVARQLAQYEKYA